MIPFVLEGQSFKKLSKARTSRWGASIYIDSALSISTKNPTKAFDYLEKALSISITDGDKLAEASAYQSLGKINFGLNQADLAISYYLKAILIFENEKEKELLNQTRTLLADAYALNKQPEKALEYYEKSLAYFGKQPNQEQALAIRNKIASIYTFLGKTKKAEDIYKDVAQDAAKTGNKKIEIEAQSKLGDIYLTETNQSQRAFNAYDKAGKIASSENDVQAFSNSLKQKSNIYRANKQYKSELQLRNQIIDLESKNNNFSEVAQQNLEIGNSYLAQNKAKEAIPAIDNSIKIAEQTGDLEQKSVALQTLSKAYSQQGDFSNAYETYKKYVETIDDLYKSKEEALKASADVASAISAKLQRLNLIEKELSLSEKTLDVLKQEHLVNQKELHSRKIFNISIGIAFLVLTIASVLIYRSSVQKRRANQMLALKSLRSQMNPHFIYNSLNSVNNYISKSDEKSANKFLSDFSRLMRAVMDNSKHDFVTIASEIQILEVYLKLEHSRFSDKFDYQFSIDPELETEQYLIPPMLIQPFIENAIWHGLRYRNEKGNLLVSLNRNSGSVKVEIEDNGIGRKKSEELKTKNQKEHSSTGLKNIENRISIINQLYHTKIGLSIVDINDNNETGTHVTLTIPVKHDSNIDES
jgi:tetratricopeptide (TPR) repeat protein